MCILSIFLPTGYVSITLRMRTRNFYMCGNSQYLLIPSVLYSVLKVAVASSHSGAAVNETYVANAGEIWISFASE